MKLRAKKLALGRETLRVLNAGDLERIGGAAPTGLPCAPTYTKETICKPCIPPGP